MIPSQIQISKKGNAVGFTAAGRTVCGEFSRKANVWRVWSQGEFVSLTNTNRQSFTTLTAAREYAASLVDDAKTNELKWW